MREKPELYEKSTDLMAQIRQNFLDVFDKLKKTQNIIIIDANIGLDDVKKEIIKYV